MKSIFKLYMFKLVILSLTMIFIVFGINSCALNKKISNFSDSLINKNNIVESKTKEVSNKSNINQEKNAKIEMMNWKCVPLYSDEHVLTLGYFLDVKKNIFSRLNIQDDEGKKILKSSQEFAMIEMQSTGKQFPALYVVNGVKHAFAFGGENFTDFMIEIDNSKRGRYYNFQNAKAGERVQSEESYTCIQTQELVDVSYLNVWLDFFKN